MLFAAGTPYQRGDGRWERGEGRGERGDGRCEMDGKRSFFLPSPFSALPSPFSALPSPLCISFAHTAEQMKRSLVLALALMVTGCASVLDIQNPTYSIRDIRPHVSIAIPLSASSIDFNFNLGVDNPHRISLPVEHQIGRAHV